MTAQEYVPAHKGDDTGFEARVSESVEFLAEMNAGRSTSLEYAAHLITREYGVAVTQTAATKHLESLKQQGVEGVLI